MTPSIFLEERMKYFLLVFLFIMLSVSFLSADTVLSGTVTSLNVMKTFTTSQVHVFNTPQHTVVAIIYDVNGNVFAHGEKPICVMTRTFKFTQNDFVVVGNKSGEKAGNTQGKASQTNNDEDEWIFDHDVPL
jgi:hypothetical protein